jgi:hypothetical protein
VAEEAEGGVLAFIGDGGHPLAQQLALRGRSRAGFAHPAAGRSVGRREMLITFALLQLGSHKLGSLQLGSHKLGSLQLGSLQLGSL